MYKIIVFFLFLCFTISEIKHVIKNLTTDIIVTSMVLIDKRKLKHMPYPFKLSIFHYIWLHFFEDRMTEVLTPDIYGAHWSQLTVYIHLQ